MANFFYTDANGQKQGPINGQQLKALASKGIIQPDTPLETDTGKEGVAGQISGLTFGEPEHATIESHSSMPPLPDSFASGSFASGSFVSGSFASMKPQAERIRESVETTDSLSFFGWLFGWILDFRFGNLQIQTTNLLQFLVIQLWLCRIVYVINFVLAILFCAGAIVVALLGLMYSVFNFDFIGIFVGFSGLLLSPVGALWWLICVRTLLEFWLLYVDQIVSTRKAAKLYIANEQSRLK